MSSVARVTTDDGVVRLVGVETVGPPGPSGSTISTIETVTAAAYTLVITDAFKFIQFNSALAQTITVPLNSTTSFLVGTKIDVHQLGAGAVTIAPAGGVTILTAAGLRLRAQYSVATLIKTATDTWVLYGDTAV